MGDAEEIHPLVCDNGSGMVKVGIYVFVFLIFMSHSNHIGLWE